jgi:transposase
MLALLGQKREVWVFMQPIDARKSYDGLYGLVKSFHSNPLNGDIFLFLSKDRKKAKALTWGGVGLMILMMRLEEGQFADVFSRGKISMSELSLFFEGSTEVKRKLSRKNSEKTYES